MPKPIILPTDPPPHCERASAVVAFLNAPACGIGIGRLLLPAGELPQRARLRNRHKGPFGHGDLGTEGLWGMGFAKIRTLPGISANFAKPP